jgi:hypothetical protein
MRMIAIHAQTERKRLDRSVRCAEKRRPWARKQRLRGLIRPDPAVCATAGAACGRKSLSSARIQAIFTSNDTPLGECRLNGLAGFLGSEGRVDTASKKLKRQNPGDLADKVENYEDMLSALRDVDRFGLTFNPSVEPTRGAAVPAFVAHPTVGLLFLPLKGAPEQTVLNWMGSIGGVGREALLRKMTQKDLRNWMKDHPGFRSFSVLRHPVDRAYHVFSRFILPDDRPAYEDVRKVLRQRYKLPIPAKPPGADWPEAEAKTAFLAFLEFLKLNLDGQTSVRVDAAWATQSAILQGMAQMMTPHHLVHEHDMAQSLPELAQKIGVADVPELQQEVTEAPVGLAQIYDGKIEKAAIDAYRRDYLTLGFPRWNKQ